MEQSKILSADILDILFDGRNKSYGAYELRKTYNKRIRYSLIGMFMVCALAVVGSLLAGGKKKSNDQIVIATIDLKSIDKPEEPKIEPPKEIPKEQPPVEQAKVTPPKIVADELVKEDDEVKPIEKLEDARIASINTEGVKDDGMTAAPPEKTGSGISDVPLKKEADIDAIVSIVQIEAQFPGGKEGWRRFLERNLNKDVPGDNGAPAARYTVIISFVVDREGNLSDIVAENDPGFGTKAEALRAITKSPKWTPAVQNGRNVKYRQRQSITFEVNGDNE